MTTEQKNLLELRKILSDVLDIDPEVITEDADFINDLEVDSLMALEVMVNLEKKFEVKIPEKELGKISCLRNVYTLLQEKGIY